MSENHPNPDELLTIRLRRRTVQDLLGDMEESLGVFAYKRSKNPLYPSEAAMFEEFPHVKEQLDAYRAALGEEAATR